MAPGKDHLYMFGRMTVTPVVHVGADADLQVAITTLLRAADQPEIVRWIEFPTLVLLFLFVPGDLESGAALENFVLRWHWAKGLREAPKGVLRLGASRRRPRASGVLPGQSGAMRSVSRKTNKSTQSPDRSWEYGTSRLGHGGYRQAGRNPSSRWVSSGHPENRSRSESSPRSG
jgi:hypothetical protein